MLHFELILCELLILLSALIEDLCLVVWCIPQGAEQVSQLNEEATLVPLSFVLHEINIIKRQIYNQERLSSAVLVS